MGTAIEKYVNNGEFNWTIGEQSGSVLRNMKNPSSVKFLMEYHIRMIIVNLVI